MTGFSKRAVFRISLDNLHRAFRAKLRSRVANPQISLNKTGTINFAEFASCEQGAKVADPSAAIGRLLCSAVSQRLPGRAGSAKR